MRIAIRRTSQALNTPIAADDVLLIGDTPADVTAGLDNGVRVVAVGSGRSSTSELREAGATTVVAGLEDLDPLLRTLSRR